MGAIPLNQVQSGMVLERDVIIGPDRLLLTGGVTLTNAHLVVLRMWGVTEVAVREVSWSDIVTQTAQGLDLERRQALEAEVVELFRHADLAHPAIEELLRLTTIRKLSREARRDGHAG